MIKRRNGMNDFDNIFVTIALWVSMMALIATTLTLPMLPSQVAIFYKPTDTDIDYYSKYNNLLNVLFSVIPAMIIIVAASLRKHNKLPRNFVSIILFCIMISLCMGGVTIYGISRQFSATSNHRSVSVHTLITLSVAAFMSIAFAVSPMLQHLPVQIAKANKRTQKQVFFWNTVDKYWNVGAYGYLAAGVVSSFIPGFFAYIPLGLFFIGSTTFIIIKARLSMQKSMKEQVEEAPSV